MINIKNRQRKIKLDIKDIEFWVSTILKFLNYQKFDIGILITNDKSIRKYNRDFRFKDKATDVLSFPFYPNLKPKNKIVPLFQDDYNLGDIILSAEYIYRDSLKYGISFNDRLKIIIIHGICHLLGYDHIDDKDFRVMRKKELSILKYLNNEISKDIKQ